MKALNYFNPVEAKIHRKASISSLGEIKVSKLLGHFHFFVQVTSTLSKIVELKIAFGCSANRFGLEHLSPPLRSFLVDNSLCWHHLRQKSF